MSALEQIALRKIEEAMERGEFDNLAGKGKPLNLAEDPFEPAELRLANKLLRDAGVAPVEVSLRRELARLKDELKLVSDEKERGELRREIRTIALRLNLAIRDVRHQVY